jgi:hypothetical protein
VAATLRITCTHSAPKGWEWANQINKGFRHPTASINGEERELKWDGSTDLVVPEGEAHKLQVFFKLFGLHWCPAEIEIGSGKDGETQAYEYHLDIKDQWVNQGNLRRV